MASRQLPKMMLGFVVRRCATAIGRQPSAAEFATWANSYQNGENTVHLFGRPISATEAQLILKHPERPVSTRDMTPYECLLDDGAAPKEDSNGSEHANGNAKITSFAEAAARLRARRVKQK